MTRHISISNECSVETASALVIDDPGQHAEPFVVPQLLKPPAIRGSGFFNPRRPGDPYNILLKRLVEDRRETFKLEEPIGYWDEDVGGIIVPANLARFRTDLTSVPQLFTWLIPKTGPHLPAALVHDGLVDEPSAPQSYIADREIDRVTADRIFRSGMRDLGTTWVRRWLIWSAVAVATALAPRPLTRAWRSWVGVALTFGIIPLLGVMATVDLLDRRELLFWMGQRPSWLEILFGAGMAILVPAVLSPLWGRQWRAGLIAGVALALLLHVTVAVGVVLAVFNTTEAIAERQAQRALRWASATAAGVLGPVTLFWWLC